MAKYRKVGLVEAWHIDEEIMPQWVMNAFNRGDFIMVMLTSMPPKKQYQIRTLEGVMTTYPGNYLCKGPKGELWSVEKSIFEETYEKVEE